MEKIRIQKFLSDCGIMSRRKAEEEIQAGRVKVNSEIAEIGQKIDPESDIVYYNGKICEPTSKKVYIKLYKPRGYGVTLSDEKGRKCVTELLDGVKERVYPIGRLDLDSEGLIFLTNDGELANKLMHPSGGLAKVYYVRVKTVPTAEQMTALNSPMNIDGYDLRPVNVTIHRIPSPSENITGASLRFVLREGRNRQIRKMSEKVGLEVSRLTRTAIGKITLAGLHPGKWEFLSYEEIQYLKKL